MSKDRENITPKKLMETGFTERRNGKNIYYKKNSFILTMGLNTWTYGWEEGNLVSGNLSQISFMDEIEPVMNFKEKK